VQPIAAAVKRHRADHTAPVADAHTAAAGRPRGVSQVARAVGLLALAGTIVPPVLFMVSALPLQTVKPVMLASAVAWFVAAPWWMKVD
jgi:hypothetical protein